MKARLISTAEMELKETLEFYESACEGFGLEFLAEVEATIRLIESYPLSWTSLSPAPAGAVHIAFLMACSIKFVATKS